MPHAIGAFQADPGLPVEPSAMIEMGFLPLLD
jgi:hypothetical protein